LLAEIRVLYRCYCVPKGEHFVPFCTIFLGGFHMIFQRKNGRWQSSTANSESVREQARWQWTKQQLRVER
jgi:hypothetical protein